MAKSLLGVYKDCVSKMLHPSLNAVIHSVLVGRRVHQAAEPTHPLSRLLHGSQTLACLCLLYSILHVYFEAVMF